MTVLDATTIETEDQIVAGVAEQELVSEPAAEPAAAPAPEADPHRIRQFTLDLPAETETSCVLLCQLGADGRWRSGYSIKRRYDTTPFEAAYEFGIETEPDCDVVFPTIGEAIADAVDRASYSLSDHSKEDDAKAMQASEWLDAWLSDFKPFAATPAFFDDPDVAERTAQPEQPATDVLTTKKTDRKPTGYRITEEAQQAFADRRHQLEEQIGKLAIEQARLKANIKSNREAMGEFTELLEKHIAAGPDQLPLFDREPVASRPAPAPDPTTSEPTKADACPRGGNHEPDEDGDCRKCLEPAAAATKPGSEAWRDLRFAGMDGISEKLAEILAGHNLLTIGDWVDWPAKNDGREYTTLKGITEKRLEKIAEAINAAVAVDAAADAVREA